MKYKIPVLALLAALCGCATVQGEGHLGDLDTFAKCEVADVATTALGLASATMVEVNPLVNALAIPALGHVLSTVVPVVGLSIAGYYILKWINKEEITMAASAATCAVALSNFAFILL